MSLEDLNLYIIGARIREQKQREQQITQAYLTAQFAMGKNIKPLNHYIKESQRANGYLRIDKSPVDIERSRRLAASIEKLDVKL